MQRKTLGLINGTALCLTLAACSPGEESPSPAPRGQTPTPAANSFIENSPGVLAFPQLRESSPQMTCDHSDSNDLVGCYVVETCASSAGGEQADAGNGQAAAEENYSWLYLLDVTNTGKLSGRLLRYGASSACQGNYLTVGLSALNMQDLRIGAPFTGANGVSITPIDAAQIIAGFRLDYISSFHLADGRLCFAEGDFTWPDSLALFFQHAADQERPTAINFSSCLLKLN